MATGMPPASSASPGLARPRLEIPPDTSKAKGCDGRGQEPRGSGRPGDLPEQDPERLAHAVARVFLEIEVGRRPLRQLDAVLAPALRARLAVAAHRPGPGPTLDAVMAVRSSRPHANACDAVVVVRRGQRVGALVVRLEWRRSAWRVVELARPEDRHPRPA